MVAEALCKADTEPTKRGRKCLFDHDLAHLDTAVNSARHAAYSAEE